MKNFSKCLYIIKRRGKKEIKTYVKYDCFKSYGQNITNLDRGNFHFSALCR